MQDSCVYAKLNPDRMNYFEGLCVPLRLTLIRIPSLLLVHIVKRLGRAKGARATSWGTSLQQAIMKVYHDPSIDVEWE